MEQTKCCSKCKEVKSLDEFSKSKSGKYGRHHYCSLCRRKDSTNRYATNFEYRKKWKIYTLKRKYNLTPDEYDVKLKNQNNCCEICNKEFKLNRMIFVDHNHVTDKTRGFLCPTCNTLLGLCNDDIERLNKVIQYLQKYK